MHPWAKKSVKKCNNYDEAELFASKAKINAFKYFFEQSGSLQSQKEWSKVFWGMMREYLGDHALFLPLFLPLHYGYLGLKEF